jgi:hypothetical protein
MGAVSTCRERTSYDRRGEGSMRGGRGEGGAERRAGAGGRFAPVQLSMRQHSRLQDTRFICFAFFCKICNFFCKKMLVKI